MVKTFFTAPHLLHTTLQTGFPFVTFVNFCSKPICTDPTSVQQFRLIPMCVELPLDLAEIDGERKPGEKWKRRSTRRIIARSRRAEQTKYRAAARHAKSRDTTDLTC